MDKVITSGIILVSLVTTAVIGAGTGTDTGEREAANHVVNTDNTPTETEQRTPSSWDVLKSAYAAYTSSPTSGGYFGKLKASLNRAYLYMFPPNIDFRGRKKEGDAVSESVERARESMEVSASKAAELTADAARKLKKTLSSSNTPPQVSSESREL